MPLRSRFRKLPSQSFNTSKTTKFSYGPSAGVDDDVLARVRRQIESGDKGDDFIDEDLPSDDEFVDGPGASSTNRRSAAAGSDSDAGGDDDDVDAASDSGAGAGAAAASTGAPVARMLSSGDRKRAMQLMQDAKQEVADREQQAQKKWKKAKRDIKNKKELVGSLLQSEKYREQAQHNAGALGKYVRERYSVDKFQQGLLQHRNEQINRTELSRKVMWSDKDRALAEIALAETEVLRDRDAAQRRGIEIERGKDVVRSTAQVTQEKLVQEVDLQSQSKIFDVELTRQAPYLVRYNQSGRHALLAGQRGHVAAVQWRKFSILSEANPSSRVNDACWLMDDSMIASAERPYTSIYDAANGSEIHVVREFGGVQFLQYLPYHFLLVGATHNTVKFLDITQGIFPGSVKLQPAITCMTQNPYNAVIVCGHTNGSVSMVTPRDQDLSPVVTMLCHQGAPVQQVAVDPTGKYLVTAAKDQKIKVWDIRKTYECVAEATAPAAVSSVAISQQGMLALSCANTVFVWKHSTLVAQKVYMRHKVPAVSLISSLDFCPFEDVLGIGHARGFSSVLIPGSGMAQYDSRLPNPYFKDRDSKDLNVKNLLEKLPAEMICLDPSIIGTSGTRARDYTFNKGVEMTPELQKELDSMGILEASRLKKRVFSSRDEQREALMAAHAEQKAKRAKHWYEADEEEGADALDRFAPAHRMKDKTHDEDVFMDGGDDDDEADAEEDGEDDAPVYRGPRQRPAAAHDSNEDEDVDDESDGGDVVFGDEDEDEDGGQADGDDDDDESPVLPRIFGGKISSKRALAVAAQDVFRVSSSSQQSDEESDDDDE